MQIKTISKADRDIDYDRLYKAYESLIDWVGTNDVDGQQTLGLLLKAAVSLAVSNHLPKNEIMEVVAVTYEMERFMRPNSYEVH